MNLTIINMEVNQFLEGMSQLVTYVHWKASEEGVSISGTTKLDPPKTLFKPYSELDEEMVKAWVLNKDLNKITTNLANTKKSVLNTAIEVPWADEYIYEEPDDVSIIRQTYQYEKAVSRLAKYILADGRKEVTEMVDTTEVIVDDEGMPILDDNNAFTYIQEEVVIISAIEPIEPTVEITVYSEDDSIAEPEPIITIDNPEITRDNLERAEAQVVIDATPQEIK
jgi:hypothetical protein